MPLIHRLQSSKRQLQLVIARCGNKNGHRHIDHLPVKLRFVGDIEPVEGAFAEQVKFGLVERSIARATLMELVLPRIESFDERARIVPCMGLGASAERDYWRAGS